MPQPQEKKEKLDSETKKYLNSYFEFNSKPSYMERLELSEKLNVPKEKIRNWFSNRRAKEKLNDENDSEIYMNVDKVYPDCNSLFIRRDFL